MSFIHVFLNKNKKKQKTYNYNYNLNTRETEKKCINVSIIKEAHLRILLSLKFVVLYKQSVVIQNPQAMKQSWQDDIIWSHNSYNFIYIATWTFKDVLHDDDS